MAGEPLQHQGEELEWRNCCIIGRLCHKGNQGGTELNEERYQGCGSVLLSRGVHECGS